MQIVGLGMAVLDVLIRLRDMPTWESGGSVSAVRIDGGGPVGTAMVAAARLGARVGFVGTAGNDLLAELKLASFVQDGVDLSHLVRRDQPEDQVVLVYVDEGSGERVFAGLRGFQRRPMETTDLDRDYITQAEFLHLDSSHYQAALQAAEWMHSAGKRVCLDGSKTDGRPIQPHMAELVRHVDILICGTGFGYSLTGKTDRWEAGEAMLALGPQIVVQTEGKDGSYTTTTDERFHLPAFEVNVVDTTGAGDVFHGAYLVGLLHGWDLRQVGLFATAVSAIKCMQLGGRLGIPRFGDVIAFLEAHNIHLPQGA